MDVAVHGDLKGQVSVRPHIGLLHVTKSVSLSKATTCRGIAGKVPDANA